MLTTVFRLIVLRNFTSLLLSGILLYFTPSRLIAQTRYTLMDLGVLNGGSSSRALAINNAGMVTGFSESELGVQAFLWDAVNGMRGLGIPSGFGRSEGWGINAQGQVALSASSGSSWRAFLWDPITGFHNIGTLESGDPSVRAFGINDTSQIVGFSNNDAIIWDSTTGMRGLGFLGGGNTAFANTINNAGQVVGIGIYANPQIFHAFIWDEINGIKDLGTLTDGTFSNVGGINASGVVVGSSGLDHDTLIYAYRWDKINGMQSMGALPYQGGAELYSFAYAINAGGVIVGETYTEPIASDQDFTGFVWTPEHGMLNLNGYVDNAEGWRIGPARGINDRGQIIAVGRTEGVHRPVLLTPVTARLSGTITLEDCADPAQTITVTLRHSNSVVDERTLTLEADGSFVLTDIPRQTYTLHIRGTKWLAKNVDVDATNGDVSGITATLQAGDANNDNGVDVFDLDALIQAFDAAPGDVNWNGGVADFTCDNSVDVLDLALLILNFDKMGEE